RPGNLSRRVRHLRVQPRHRAVSARPRPADRPACRPLECPNVALTAGNAEALAREARHLDTELASPGKLPPLLGRRLTERRDRITAYLARHTPEKPCPAMSRCRTPPRYA